jgi:hypothetical protein
MLTELSKKGRWVTFRNGQRAYISKKGRVETGILKGLTLGKESDKEKIAKRFAKLKKKAAKSK